MFLKIYKLNLFLSCDVKSRYVLVLVIFKVKQTPIPVSVCSELPNNC